MKMKVELKYFDSGDRNILNGLLLLRLHNKHVDKNA